MISPLALECEKVFACDREEVGVGKTGRTTSARVVSDHHQDYEYYDHDQDYVMMIMTATMMMIIHITLLVPVK